MSINTVIIIAFALMVLVLFQGLYHMLRAPRKDGENQKNLARALTWRIGIWVVLFAFIVISKHLGWLQPSNSIHPTNFQKELDARSQQ